MDLDPSLRRERNVEVMRVAQLRHQLTTGARGDRAALQAAAARLAALDRQIASAIAKSEQFADVGKFQDAPVAPARPAAPDPAEVHEARAVPVAHQLRAALAAEIEKLSA